jgi:hypothetical protein
MNTRTTFSGRSLAALAVGGLLTLATALPATAGQAPGVVLPDPVGTPVPQTRVLFVDDNALEFIQIGLGAVGGIALAGAGAATMRSRRHHHPQLA